MGGFYQAKRVEINLSEVDFAYPVFDCETLVNQQVRFDSL